MTQRNFLIWVVYIQNRIHDIVVCTGEGLRCGRWVVRSLGIGLGNMLIIMWYLGAELGVYFGGVCLGGGL